MEISLKERFEGDGYAVEEIFTQSECAEWVSRLKNLARPQGWAKGNAAQWPAFYEIGSDRRIVDRVAELLGEDVMLWGCTLVRRQPGKVHPWHTDIESSVPDGRTATVWIGLENTTVRSSLHVVSGSHLFGKTVQEHAFLENTPRTDLDTSDIMRWAKEYDEASRMEVLDMKDGDAAFFDGRLWHGTHNTTGGLRTAIILQYATPQTAIRIPDYGEFEFPFVFLDEPRPPCVMVRGSGRDAPNHIVPPPVLVPEGRHAGKSWVKHLELPLDEAEKRGWQPYPIYRGSTPALSRLSCHVSVLSEGRTPHEPHEHGQEEILIMLSGTAELVLVDAEDVGKERRHTVRRGHFAFYPSGQLHTIHNAGAEPATYLMFKWDGGVHASNGHHLETCVYEAGEQADDASNERAFRTRRVFEGPTRHLPKLHCHVSTLKPGGGYDAHIDAYDVAIVVLNGVIETLDQQCGPNSVIFYAAGEPHGMKNAGSEPAFYIVFEFHGTASVSAASGGKPRVVAKTLRRVRRLARRVRRKLQRMASTD